MENISHYNVQRAFQKRQILAIYAFFGYFVAYSMRTILSVAIIDMNGKKLENDSCTDECEVGAKLPSGAYIVKVKSKRNTESLKIVKE